MSAINYPLHTLRAVVFDVDGVLSPSVVPMDANGVPMRMANLKDGYAIKTAVQQGLIVAIISGADTEAVRLRFQKVGVRDIFLAVRSKIEVLDSWMADNGLQPNEVAFCGDDIPDIEAMRHVGLAVAPSDAAHEAREAAQYVTRATGGYGVARELLEQILRAQDRWPKTANAYG